MSLALINCSCCSWVAKLKSMSSKSPENVFENENSSSFSISLNASAGLAK